MMDIKETYNPIGDALERLLGKDIAIYILSEYVKDPQDLLHYISNGNIDFVKYLISLGMEVQSQKYFDAAIKSGNIKMVKLIMSQRENFIRDLNNGLKTACQCGHMNIVNFMIEKGANNWNWALIGGSRCGHIYSGIFGKCKSVIKKIYHSYIKKN